MNNKTQDWVLYHDEKTSGVMGLLSLVKNMPLRITATDPQKNGGAQQKIKSADATVAANSCRDHISQDEANSLTNLY